ncbi:RNA-guided pseudouridylation complex pseudouridine synthase subunit Cbf5 [Candidatus Parvarchaeota archaeon]|jgi:H/ACA ribonucleoprotein complex subunit 4|nr:MAG: RNA-guided pseudouridylation complex pseudouridine synthase subunit Cbf5 [Candidatus Parvarchaeota archaeon]HIG51816.1 RNA-guided pseudouridylation complex pseudouridine synthase subunit Cbf5 [Candidatus Pacearchaeota archaeon]
MKLNLDKIKKEKTTEELLQFSIINIDKPTGPTSFWTSQFVKKSLNLRKTSHLGTLDPIVTGVLPVALNRACKLNDYLMHRDKVYVGIMRTHEEVEESKLKEEMKKFIGKIKQLPPVRSNVKRAERIREIKEFKIIEKNGKDVLFFSDVQAGTYIRKLIHDLGEKIGGAHMIELRRTKASLFEEIDSVNLYDFEKAFEEYKKGNDEKLREILIPGEIISEVIPVVQIRKDVVKKCLTGSPIFQTFLEKDSEIEKDSKICIFSGEKFIGCYNVINSGDLFAKPEFVKN